jgi:hypothetical protein
MDMTTSHYNEMTDKRHAEGDANGGFAHNFTKEEMELDLWLMAADAKLDEFKLLDAEMKDITERTDALISVRENVKAQLKR